MIQQFFLSDVAHAFRALAQFSLLRADPQMLSVYREDKGF